MAVQSVQVLFEGEIYNNVVGVIYDDKPTRVIGFADCEEIRMVQNAIDMIHEMDCNQVTFASGMIVNRI